MVMWMLAVTMGCGKAPPPAVGSANSADQHPRTTVRDLLDDYDVLASLAHLVPHRDSSGSYVGFRVSELRDATLAERLGIAHGDILHSVNHHALTSPEEALKAYEAVQEADVLRLAITRDQTSITISIDLEMPLP
ncbi:MAG: hypothetical protein AAF211_17830 [Myxococcota bacterium]